MSIRSKKDLPTGCYEDDNQRSFSTSKMNQLTQRTGINIKGYLPKDREKEMNRLEEMERQDMRADAMKKDPTLAASLNGNKPARGARIDKELMEEDQKMVQKMNLKKTNERMTMESKYL